MPVEALKSFFDVATVILLFLTFLAGAGVLITGNIINDRQQEKLRQFDKDLTHAKTELETAREQASEAAKGAYDAERAASDAIAKQKQIQLDLSKQEERAAVAEKQLLEMQQRLADRTLSDAQVTNISEKLKQFAGQEYEVVAYWDSKESVGIANRIHQALQKASWKYDPPEKRHFIIGELVGIQVWRHPDADDSAKRAVQSLVDILQAEGLQAEIQIQNPENNPKNNRIGLDVGSKR